MNNHSEGDDRKLARTVTAAGLYVLARIYSWEVKAWRPKTNRRPALVVLNDPAQSSVNPRVVTQLMGEGLVTEANDTLIVTAAGREVLLKRPEIILRMQSSGAI